MTRSSQRARLVPVSPLPDDAKAITFKGRTCYFDMTGTDVNSAGSIDACIIRGEFYEQKFLHYIASLNIRGTYLDVGACIGTHTVFFAMCCPADHVFAFEPRDGHRERIERTLKLNDLLDKVTVSGWALSDTAGEVTVELDGRVQTLPTERLDDLLDSPVALMKIDVEGMEPRVLAGATRLLARYRPRVFAEAHTDKDREQVHELLRPFGYQATGRVFNASPTYEFAVPPPAWKRLARRGKRKVRRLLK